MNDWPDWHGQIAAIVASGPSAKKGNLSLLKSVRVLAIKKSIELVPFAEVVYGCDGPWWRSVNGLMNFQGLKLCYDIAVTGSEFGIQRVQIPNNKCDQLLFGEIGTVGAGGNSGFQALNLALQFGARKILLIGLDAHGSYGHEHWYGRNTAWRMNNPDENNYRHWRVAFRGVSEKIKEMGGDVINTSLDSSIDCFPKMSIETAFKRWDMQIAAA